MKCRACKNKAVIRLPSHNSAFCPECFDRFTLSQTKKAIDDYRMVTAGDHVLVAVSGGKDSLALWDILTRLGYRTTGFHLDLGIGEYSSESRSHVESFAARHGLPLVVESLRESVNGSVTDISKATRRPACSGCGMSKRYFFNKVALATKATVLATGHNLDDEASRLFGNLLHWHDEYLAKNRPDLSAISGLAKKVKPLVRLTEKEMAAYAFLRKIPYVVKECPHSVDAKQILFKKVLGEIEAASPGTKHAFLFGYLDRISRWYPDAPEEEEDVPTGRCEQCGEISWTPVCSFCRMKEKVARELSRQEELR
ncbi:MAG: ATP-binding protein [Leptospirillia bacterium]